MFPVACYPKMSCLGGGAAEPPTLTGWGEGGDGSDLGNYYVAAVNLTWGAIPGASGYDIYRAIAATSIDPLATYSLLFSQAGITYRDTTVDWSAGEGYGYKVSVTGNSEFSNALRFDALPPPPSPSNSYLRPDGVSYFLRPDGVSRYLRP